MIKEKIQSADLFRYFILYKPFRVLCQFSPIEGKKTLKELFEFPKDVYPVGRLDEDTEGLLILTNDTSLNNKLLDPKNSHIRTYLAQLEGIISDEALKRLEAGLAIKVRGERHKTKSALSKFLVDEPMVPLRIPPIRFRKNSPTSWIELSLTEGKNHQVRKMTATVGFPTLRLIRWKIENLTVEKMNSGDVIEIEKTEIYRLLKLH